MDIRLQAKIGALAVVAGLLVSSAGAGVLAPTQSFATIGGGAATDKLRFDPGGAANQGGAIGRFWQSTNSAVGNNFAGGCPSQGSGGWWQSSQPPLRGIQGWIGTTGCQTAGSPAGHLTLVVEEASAAGDAALFVALRVDETPAAIRWWDLSRVDPSPSPSVLPLYELPRPVVAGTSSAGGSLVNLELVFPDVAGGVHAVSGAANTDLPASAVVASYDLYRVETSTDPGRDAATWTLVHQEPYTDGPGAATLTVDCQTEQLFALGLSFDGGTGPDVPGALVSKPLPIDCGPGLPPIQGIGVVDFGQGECLAGEHFLLRDLCGAGSLELFSTELDLASHACEVVHVEGQDVSPGCSVMDVETLLPAEPPCLVQVRNLELDATPDELALTWEPLPCADGYDVIRGTLPVTANLGPVLCLADDAPEATADDATGDSPAAAEAFFYLVRANGPTGSRHYGHTSATEPRMPSSGDCF